MSCSLLAVVCRNFTAGRSPIEIFLAPGYFIAVSRADSTIFTLSPEFLKGVILKLPVHLETLKNANVPSSSESYSAQSDGRVKLNQLLGEVKRVGCMLRM